MGKFPLYFAGILLTNPDMVESGPNILQLLRDKLQRLLGESQLRQYGLAILITTRMGRHASPRSFCWVCFISGDLTNISANEENTFNINDLWVSAAIAQETSVFDDEDDNEEDEGTETENGTPAASPAPPSEGRETSARRYTNRRIVSGSLHPGHRLSTSQGGRRFSTSSGLMPAIFANTGLSTPPIALGPDGTTPASAGSAANDPFFPTPARAGGLSAIAENRSSVITEHSPLVSPNIQMTEKPASSWRMLPKLMIVQVSLTYVHH